MTESVHSTRISTPPHWFYDNSIVKTVDSITRVGLKIITCGLYQGESEITGTSEFFTACNRGNINAIKDYLEKNPGAVHEVNEKGDSALFFAIQNNQTAVASLLIEKGASINKPNKAGQAPIHLAASLNDEKMAALLLSRAVLIDVVDDKGCAPIHLAVLAGNAKILSMLIENGAYVNAKFHGFTPLMVALKNGNHSCAKVLLQCPKIDPSISLMNRTNALHLALLHGAPRSIVKDLIAKNGCPINAAMDVGRWTPLHLAVINGREEDVTNLILAGARIDPIDALGETPLHIALKNGNGAIAEILINYGAQSDLQDANGKAPLHLALGTYDYETTKLIKRNLNRIRECPYELVDVFQRGENGEFLKNEKGAPKIFAFDMDRRSKDMYQIENSTPFLKALGTLILTPLYAGVSLIEKIAKAIMFAVVLPFVAIAESFSALCRLKLFEAIKSLAIIPIGTFAIAASSIWDIAATPLYATAMMAASVYVLFNSQEGRRLLNNIATHWDSLLTTKCNGAALLWLTGMAKVGNLTKSELAGRAQFQLQQRKQSI